MQYGPATSPGRLVWNLLIHERLTYRRPAGTGGANDRLDPSPMDLRSGRVHGGEPFSSPASTDRSLTRSQIPFYI